MARTRPRSFAGTGKAAGKRREEDRERGVEVLPEGDVLLARDVLGDRMFLGVFFGVSLPNPNEQRC